MTDIIFTIPNAETPRLINGIATAYNYQANVQQPDGSTIPNPETKAQFAKRMTIAWWRSLIKAVEINDAKKQAETTYQGAAVDVDIT